MVRIKQIIKTLLSVVWGHTVVEWSVNLPYSKMSLSINFSLLMVSAYSPHLSVSVGWRLGVQRWWSGVKERQNSCLISESFRFHSTSWVGVVSVGHQSYSCGDP